MTVRGDPPMIRVLPRNTKDRRAANFYSGMHRRGVYMIQGSAFASLAHTASDVDMTIQAALETITDLGE